MLRTRFERATLARRNGSARVTIDFGVTLERPGGDAVTIRDGLILVESERGRDAPADHALRSTRARSRSRSTGPARRAVRRDTTGDLDGIRELFARAGSR